MIGRGSEFDYPSSAVKTYKGSDFASEFVSSRRDFKLSTYDVRGDRTELDVRISYMGRAAPLRGLHATH